MVPLIRIRSVSLHLQWSFFLVINGLSSTSIYLCILPSYPLKFLIPLFSLFYFPLYLSMFHSVPNRDIPKLGTPHLSFLILILSPLSSHFVRFSSLHSVSKSKNKLKITQKTTILFFQSLLYHLFLFLILPSCFLRVIPNLLIHRNPPEPRSLLDHRRPD